MCQPRCLYVTLLGSFSMRLSQDGRERTVTEQESTSRRLWTFLQYLLTYSARNVTQEELIEVLWGDSDISDPVNTLKTLLHRARNMLESLGLPDGKRVLLYRRGVYSWSPELNLQTDIDEFDRLSAQFSAASRSPEGLDAAIRAVALYQGDFLPSASGSPWAISLRTHYHSRFLQLCGEAANILQSMGSSDRALELARAATAMDPYDEPSHLLYMELLSAFGAQQAAIQHYTYVTKLFMDQLGVAPSEEMVQLYRSLSKSTEGLELDLRVVREELLEKDEQAGAFFCEYAVFQDIYRLEARIARRTGQVIELVMMTLLGKQGHRLTPSDAASSMSDLRSAIHSSLRSGDIFTRSSPIQFLILLPSASYENAVKVCQRILAAFSQTSGGRISSPSYSLLPVLPYKEDKGEDFQPFHRFTTG